MLSVHIREATPSEGAAIWNINMRAWPGCSVAELLERRHGVLDDRPWPEDMAGAIALRVGR